ncbi:hypothetical protein GALL_540970 [mine drainage metagenome]|uniref:Uncharacterized protein n=1 Tax=mine drainage metagenome TaxID=410659 RepID=A0A1J5P969_9ZZZZ
MRQNSMNQLVGVQTAFHQHFNIITGGQLGRFFGCRMTVLDRHDFGTVEINAKFFCNPANPDFRSNQHRDDQAMVGCIHGTAE